MANKVLLKKSSVAAKIPLTGDLDYGELALNYADGKLYFKDSSNQINFLGSSSATETLTNKSISLSNNTLTGTVAQFNSALSDGDFATIAGTETLTNKTLNGVTLTGAVTAGGNTGANGYILTSTGSGVQWVSNTAGTLDGLTDVTITAPTAQQVLKFNGSIWQNADPDTSIASAVFATNAESDLGLVTDLIIGTSEDLGFVTEVAAYIYNMGSLVVDGIVSLNNIDQSIKADYISYSIIFGF